MKILTDRKGEGKLGLIITLIIVCIGIYAAYKIIPVKFNIGVFNEYLEDQCRLFQSGTELDIEKVIKAITERAAELNLPLEQKNVSVERKPGRIVITVKYTAEIPFPGYTLKMVGDNTLDRQVF